ncbi:hypothetical protein AB1K84_05205 [Mesobacillus foraminis]|uniref:hypothetical protein n=1 Tax=Mesobacillus foraminis TaxID=279826 RepID=UPI0039A1DB29
MISFRTLFYLILLFIIRESLLIRVEGAKTPAVAWARETPQELNAFRRLPRATRENDGPGTEINKLIDGLI